METEPITTDHILNEDHLTLVQPHLQPGEQVLWTGQPSVQRMVWNYLWPGWGATIVVALALIVAGVDLLLMLLVLPVLLLTTLLLGVFWIRPDARRTVYALTDRRVLVFNRQRGSVVQELEAHHIGGLRRYDHKDGTGDLFFANDDYRRSVRRGKTRHFGFIGIPDAPTVEQHMRDVFPHYGDYESNQ